MSSYRKDYSDSESGCNSCRQCFKYQRERSRSPKKHHRRSPREYICRKCDKKIMEKKKKYCCCSIEKKTSNQGSLPCQGEPSNKDEKYVVINIHSFDCSK